MKASELEVLIDRIVKAERLADARNNSIAISRRDIENISAQKDQYLDAANATAIAMRNMQSSLESMYFLVIDLCEKVKSGAPLIAQEVEATIEQANNLRGTK